MEDKKSLLSILLEHVLPSSTSYICSHLLIYSFLYIARIENASILVLYLVSPHLAIHRILHGMDLFANICQPTFFHATSRLHPMVTVVHVLLDIGAELPVHF
jgi:hypothetical protein